MNKKIKEIKKKINCQDVLNKKNNPVWFFTNERISNFLNSLKEINKSKKVFSIGGGGDFGFSILSNNTKEIDFCDIRQTANITIDLKIALFKKLSYKEVLSLFLKKEFFNKEEVYKKIKQTISPKTKRVLKSIIKNSKNDSFLKTIKNSGLWYKSSFWQIRDKKDYLPYLSSKKDYELVQNNLEKINIYCGDFKDNLKLFDDNSFNLIYSSNIFDHKNYCSNPASYLKIVKRKLNRNGLLFIITQSKSKKTTRLIKKEGLCLFKKELNKFNPFTGLLGHYSYSFLLFKKI